MVSSGVPAESALGVHLDVSVRAPHGALTAMTAVPAGGVSDVAELRRRLARLKASQH